MSYRGLFLADIHIGAMSYENTYDGISYLREKLQELTKEKPLDFIIIGGDFFDKQLYANDPFIGLAQKLMLFFLVSAKKVRVVYGTSSHESDQYGIFDTLAADIPQLLGKELPYDFKVIDTISEEELYPGMHVLYMPEEYVFDKEEYYKEFFLEKDKYDYVFGHGMINEAFPYIKPSTTKDHIRRKAPSFTADELADICKGEVIFGHYHIRKEWLDGKVSYVGSTFRWIHGEEEDKGFYLLNFDEGTCKKTFLINEKALKYVTMSYGYKDSVFNSYEDMENEAKKILDKKKKYEIDNLRVVFNIPVGYDNPEGLMNFFKERFKDVNGLKLAFSHGYVQNEKDLAKVDLSELDEDTKILLDRNVDQAEKVSYFLKVRKNVEMSAERVRERLGIKED
jgi:DNA repair exonuclease SbcCD nuclease subunit